MKSKLHQMCSGRFLLSVLWAFCVLYQPPLPVSVIYLLTAGSFAYLFCFARRKLKSYVVLVVPFVVMFLLLMTVSLLNGAAVADISHFFWLMVCILPAGLAFSSMCDKTADGLMRVLTTAACLQAGLAFAGLLIPSVQDTLHGLMQRYGLYSGQHLAVWGHRIYGYGTSLMFAIPVVQSVISAWLLLRAILQKKLLPAMLALAIMFSAVINAKISLFTFAAALGTGLVLERRYVTRRLLFIALLGSVAALALMYGAEVLLEGNTRLVDWLTLLQDEELVTRFYVSYYTDPEKYRLPEGLAVIWGTGEPRPNADVDMGFINDLWIGGIIYAGFTMATVLRWVRLIRRNAVGGERWARVMGWSLLAVYLVANMKGTAFSYSSFMAFFVLVALYGYGERRRMIRRIVRWKS